MATARLKTSKNKNGKSKNFGHTVAMTFERETKGTFLYKADDGNEAPVTGMYIRKMDRVRKDVPDTITVTVE